MTENSTSKQSNKPGKSSPSTVVPDELGRRIKHSRDSVIILIGGASGVGKTTVAAELARRLGITRHISTDIIREIIRALEPGNSCVQGSTFAQAGKRRSGNQDSSESDPGEHVIQGFLAQARAVNIGLRAILSRARREGINMVVDGANFVPSLLGHGFLHPAGAQVFSFILTLEDRERHIERFRLRSSSSRRSARRYIDHIHEIHRIQDFLREDAGKSAVPVIENKELERTVAAILRIISERLV